MAHKFSIETSSFACCWNFSFEYASQSQCEWYFYAKSIKWRFEICVSFLILVFITPVTACGLTDRSPSHEMNILISQKSYIFNTCTHTNTVAHFEIDECGDNKKITNFQSKATMMRTASQRSQTFWFFFFFCFLIFICVSSLLVGYHGNNGAYLATALKWESPSPTVSWPLINGNVRFDAFKRFFFYVCFYEMFALIPVAMLIVLCHNTQTLGNSALVRALSMHF